MLTGVYNKFNRGEIDGRALARDDIERAYNACSLMRNFLPLRLGGMQYRSGLGKYLGTTAAACRIIPFQYTISDTANLEVSDSLLRIWLSDTLITRTSVTSAFTNGTFDTVITGWTDASGAGSSTGWETGGYAYLLGSGTSKAVLYQTIAATDTGSEHACRIVIARAPVTVKIGTSGVGSSDLFEGELLPGTHSLVFTPSSNITVTFSSYRKYKALVDSISFEATGTFTLPVPVTTSYVQTLKYKQVNDIVYCAWSGGLQFQIERRGLKSWSVVDHRVDDGPFGIVNLTDISMTAGALTGDTTLTASDDYFTSDDVGVLFRLASTSQTREASVVAEDNGTGSIFVTGAGNSRIFSISITGTWSATVTLQRSTDDATWDDVKTYTANASETHDDNLDNALLYYRLHVKAGDYTSGTVELTLSYSSGSIEGVARVTGYTSTTVVSVQVLTAFGSTDSTRDWYRGEWSASGIYPSAVEMYEGRLWWAGSSRLWGSVSDAYTSFDSSIEGDSKAIQKTIASEFSDSTYWLAGGTQLAVGTVKDEVKVRSNDFGDVLSSTNINLRPGPGMGTGNVHPAIVNGEIYFVNSLNYRLCRLEYPTAADSQVFSELNMMNESIISGSVVDMAVSRDPEVRVYLVLSDGTVAACTVDKTEEMLAWSRITTDGTIENVAVAPGANGDDVYWVVSRTGGRYFEKMPPLSAADGSVTSAHLDSYLTYTSPGTTITGLSHLEGKTVTVWGDGQTRGTYTVSSGQITVGSSWTNVTVGLAHVADWVSNKAGGFAPGNASVLGVRKRIVDTGFVLRNYVPGSLQVGPTEALLKSLPLIEDGTSVGDTVISEYDEIPFEFDGEDEVDPRIYIRGTGPCTVSGLVYNVKDPRNPTSQQG